MPNKHRPYANLAMYVFSLHFASFGPVISRSFVLYTKLSWRWSYYLNTILNGLVTILFFLFYHPPTLAMLHAKSQKKSLLQLLDIGGVILFAIGLFVLLLGISWGGEQYSWDSGQVIVTIVGGGMLLIVFTFYGSCAIRGSTVKKRQRISLLTKLEIYMPIQYPLMPTRLWKNSGYVATRMTASMGAMIYYSMNVLWPMQISALYTTDMMQIGWLSCAVGGSTTLGNLSGCLTCRNLGHQ